MIKLRVETVARDGRSTIPRKFAGQFIYKFEPKLERQQLKYLINQFSVYRPSWHYQQTIFAEFPHLDGSPF